MCSRKRSNMNNNIMAMVLQSISVLSDYMYEFKQLDMKSSRISQEYKIMSRRISVAEKVALEQIRFQKLVLKKSLSASTKDLASLSASRETMIKAIGKFSESIMAKKSSKAERECAYKLISLLSHELEELRNDSEARFNLLNSNVMKALQGPVANTKALKIGDSCIF